MSFRPWSGTEPMCAAELAWQDGTRLRLPCWSITLEGPVNFGGDPESRRLTTNTAGPMEEFHQPGPRTGMALKAAGGVLVGVGQGIALTLPSQSTTWRALFCCWRNSWTISFSRILF